MRECRMRRETLSSFHMLSRSLLKGQLQIKLLTGRAEDAEKTISTIRGTMDAILVSMQQFREAEAEGK